MDTLERIFVRLAFLGIEQKQLAETIGVLPQAVTDWKNGKTKSYRKYLPQIAEVLGVSVQWLLTGEELSQGKAPTPEAGGIPDILVQFNNLSPGAQKEVIAFIEFKRTQELGGQHE